MSAPRSAAKAVVIGALIDIGGSLGVGQILMVGYAVFLAVEGASVPELQEAMTHMDPSSGIGLAQSVLGTLCSWLGGYVCARLAPPPELKWAALLAVISTLAALATLLLPSVDYPLPLLVLLMLLGAAAVMVGGWMGMRRNAGREAAGP